MNAFDHFRTEIDGTGVHFIHAPSPVEGALPLLLTHGWPGSFVEFLDVIEPLARSRGARRRSRRRVPRRRRRRCPATGSRDRRVERGWHPGRIARAVGAADGRPRVRPLRRGGRRLGLLIVTRQVGIADPEHCAGIHLNMALARIPMTEDITPEEQGVPRRR